MGSELPHGTPVAAAPPTMRVATVGGSRASRARWRAARRTWATAAALVAGCAGESQRPANAPLSDAAAAVVVVEAPATGCKKLGSAHGSGREIDEAIAARLALDGAREQAARVHGNTIVVVGHRSDVDAGSGGVVHKVTKTVDVYECPPRKE